MSHVMLNRILLLCYAMSLVLLVGSPLLTDLQQAIRDVTEQILVVNPDNSEALVSHIKVECMPTCMIEPILQSPCCMFRVTGIKLVFGSAA